MENDIEQLKTKPKWIKEENGKFTAELKGIKYIMKEQKGSVLDTCEKRAEKGLNSLEVLLAKESLIEPKLTDQDFENLPGSVYLKLKLMTIYVYELNDFL